jgi:hypothetical protein
MLFFHEKSLCASRNHIIFQVEIWLKFASKRNGALLYNYDWQQGSAKVDRHPNFDDEPAPTSAPSTGCLLLLSCG